LRQEADEPLAGNRIHVLHAHASQFVAAKSAPEPEQDECLIPMEFQALAGVARRGRIGDPGIQPDDDPGKLIELERPGLLFLGRMTGIVVSLAAKADQDVA